MTALSLSLLLLHLILLLSLSSLSSLSLASSSAPALRSWAGADSFFLFALSESDRHAHLSAMQRASMRVVRIFISAVGDRAKGSSSTATPDLEPQTVGVFDDTILRRIDQLMVEAVQYSVKLDISMHDRYALGCWSEDAYYAKYRFPSGYPGCNAQRNDVRAFYQNASIEADFDRRLLHVVQHRNPLMGNRTWGQIPEAIFTLAAQNEAQSFIRSQDWGWQCRRAAVMRPHVHASILMSTNGATVADSLQTDLFTCPHLDLMAVHNYGGDRAFAANYSRVARQLAVRYGKRVYVEEFGALGHASVKAAGLGAQIDGMMDSHVPWMFWELLRPGGTDYETWTDDEAWAALSNRSQAAAKDLDGAFAWPELYPEQREEAEGRGKREEGRGMNVRRE